MARRAKRAGTRSAGRSKRPSKAGGRASARKAARPRPARRATRRPHPAGRTFGWITHTDIASADPAATQAWCEAVLKWQFRPPFPGPGPEYHLFIYSAQGGGGIRRTEGSEAPGAVPFVHVRDTQAAFDAALAAGAREIQKPTRVMEGVRIASVRAPGGVVIGFSGP